MNRSIKLVVVLCGVVLCGALTACSESSRTDDAPGSVEITHALGTTTVPPDVEQIVALGPTGVDVALSLDAPVIGAAAIGSDEGLSPWASHDSRASDIKVLPVTGEATEVNIEQVAKLKPDLIFAPSYYALEKSYKKLSAIAPTIGYQRGPAQDTWQEMTKQLATALDRPDDADGVVDSVQTKLDATRKAHPNLKGATYTFGFVQADSITVLRDPDDVMNSVTAALGLKLSPQVLALPKGESFGVQLSPEKITSLDADVLALFSGGDKQARKRLEQNRLFEHLPVVQRKAVVNYSYDEFMALRNPSPLSVPWIVDRVAPRLSKAVAQ